MIRKGKKVRYLAPLFVVTFLTAWVWHGDSHGDAEYVGAGEPGKTDAVSRPAISQVEFKTGDAAGSAEVTGAAVDESKKPVFARKGSLRNAKVATAEEIRVRLEFRKKEEEKETARKKAAAEKKKRAMQKKAAVKRQQREAKRPYIIKDVPSGNEVKKYERYTLLTRWKQAELQKIAHTDKNGMRKVGERYCVALGSYYSTEIGTEFDLLMENGNVIPCILGDQKSDLHTDAKHQRGNNDGCVAEFIVDDERLQQTAKVRGSVHWIPEFAGEIKAIKIYTDKKGI